MKTDLIEARLREARFNHRVDSGLNREILAAARRAESASSPTSRFGRRSGWARFFLQPIGAGAAVAVMAIAAITGVWLWRAAGTSPMLPPPPAVSDAVWTQSRPLALPLRVASVEPLEAEWQALASDLRRLQPKLPWRPRPGEI